MAKCCKKCAYRHGSPERRDEWGWLFLQEGHQETEVPFYCHESVPGHHQEIVDGRPRWRVCAGYAATRNTPIMTMMHRTKLDQVELKD